LFLYSPKQEANEQWRKATLFLEETKN